LVPSNPEHKGRLRKQHDKWEGDLERRLFLEKKEIQVPKGLGEKMRATNETRRKKPASKAPKWGETPKAL